MVIDAISNVKISPVPHGKKTREPDYIGRVPASGFIFGYPAAQSVQCFCAAGGSHEAAGWRWGFPALP